MKFEDTALLISQRPFLGRELVVKEWVRRGGGVVHLDRFWRVEGDVCQRKMPILYGNAMFCETVAERLNLSLVTPSNEALISFPYELTKRTLWLSDLRTALQIDGEIFVKPLRQKLFEARVYRTSEELASQCVGIARSTPVLLSEVVDFTSEARAFILDGKLLDCAVYRGAGVETGLRDFTVDLTASVDGLPSSFVVDVGHIPEKGWAVVELNPSWGSCLRRCSPELATECIARGTLKECA